MFFKFGHVIRFLVSTALVGGIAACTFEATDPEDGANGSAQTEADGGATAYADCVDGGPGGLSDPIADGGTTTYPIADASAPEDGGRRRHRRGHDGGTWGDGADGGVDYDAGSYADASYYGD